MLPQETSTSKFVPGYNSNGSSNESNANEKPQGGDIQASAKSDGYSADGSAAATAPPVYIGFLDAHKRGGKGVANNGQARNSRRNAIELSYRASRAMADLEKGGLPIPRIQVEERRDLEGCQVDMTKVKLVTAKTVSQSPFLIKWSPCGVKTPESTQEYNSLFVATYQSYEKNDASHWDSSTSSVTSSESDDAASMPPPALVLHPRLEDGLKAANEALKNSDDNAKRTKRKHSSLNTKLQHITMNDALEASNEARVVTLSFSPFIVVHVNTAYTRLTGYSSAKVLGKPLQDCLSSRCKGWMKCCISPHPISGLHDRVAPIRSKGKTKQNSYHRLYASLVGPQLEGKKEVDTSMVTHYSVSFLPIPRSSHPPHKSAAASACKKAKVAISTARATFSSDATSDGDPKLVMG